MVNSVLAQTIYVVDVQVVIVKQQSDDIKWVLSDGVDKWIEASFIDLINRWTLVDECLDIIGQIRFIEVRLVVFWRLLLEFFNWNVFAAHIVEDGALEYLIVFLLDREHELQNWVLISDSDQFECHEPIFLN